MRRPCFYPSIASLDAVTRDDTLPEHTKEDAAAELKLKRTIAHEGFPSLGSTGDHKFPALDDVPQDLRGSCNYQIYDALSRGANPDDDKECYIANLLLSTFPWPPGDATQVRDQEGLKEVQDSECRRCAEGFIATWEFFKENLLRDSIDGKGMVITGVIHWGPSKNYGSRRVFGDAMWDTNQRRIWFGEGQTERIDTIGHELMHGVLDSVVVFDEGDYDEASALNESIADCFGEMVSQYSPRVLRKLREGISGEPRTVETAEWKVSDSERTFKGPSTKRCPKVMADYSREPSDRPGWAEDFIHTMCGIPSHAFWVACDKLREQFPYSWDRVGKIWYHAVTDTDDTEERKPLLRKDSTFRYFAALTVAAAERHFPEEVQTVVEAVREAWSDIGIENLGTIDQESSWLDQQEVKESKTPRPV